MPFSTGVNGGMTKSSSAGSLPVVASLPQSAEDLLNVTNAVDKVDRPLISAAPAQTAFWLQVKNTKDISEPLSVKEPSGVLKIGRSFQPESFWRSLASEACPAISREHFSISAVRQRSGSVVEGEDAFPASRGANYKFSLCCNSLNGLAVLNPGADNPVFLQKDTPGASAYEIFDGTEIELAGVIRLVFREGLNPHNGTMSSAAGSGTRSINYVPAAVLRPPLSANSAASVKPGVNAGSANASFLSDGGDIDDVFFKTGFRAAA